jgi:DNA-binding transcriptional LysR family regulator
MLYFTEICRYKSFSKAAERLYISQQGISMAIYRLEEELSCKLFYRTGRELHLTENGEFLLEHAQEIVRQFQLCEEYFDREKSAKRLRKTLRISAAYGTMAEFGGELIFLFRQQYPENLLNVLESSDWECEESVWNEDSELGFSLAPIDQRRFESMSLFTRRFCLLVHKTHPLSSEKRVPLDVLRDMPVMMMDNRSKANQIIMQCCREAGFQPDVQFTAGEVIGIHRLVNANKGVGISVESIAEDLGQANIVSIPFEDPRMIWDAHLFKKRGVSLSPIAKTFERYVIRQMRKTPERGYRIEPDAPADRQQTAEIHSKTAEP